MKTYSKHHYAAEAWTQGKPSKGLLLASYQEGDSFNTCTRCGCPVKLTKTGTMKFWVGGKWISKRPPCQVTAQATLRRLSRAPETSDLLQQVLGDGPPVVFGAPSGAFRKK
jgi:hypothetical protein